MNNCNKGVLFPYWDSNLEPPTWRSKPLSLELWTYPHTVLIYWTSLRKSQGPRKQTSLLAKSSISQTTRWKKFPILESSEKKFPILESSDKR